MITTFRSIACALAAIFVLTPFSVSAKLFRTREVRPEVGVYTYSKLMNASSLRKQVKSALGSKVRSSATTRMSGADVLSNEIIVRFKGKQRSEKVRISEPVSAALRKYRSRNDVVFAEPNFLMRTLAVPNDVHYPLQWHLDNASGTGVEAEEAWNVQTGTGTIIALIDTGVAYETAPGFVQAPDLESTCFVPGYDFVNDDSHPNDDNSHGTHIAGTLAQSTNNALGTAGLAFNSCIMPLKALDQNGEGTYSDVADSIYFAVDNGARVINMSFGGPTSSQEINDALRYADEHEVVVVSAAGNEGVSTLSYPAFVSSVIAVAATRYDGQLTRYTSFGEGLDLVAPGGDLSLDQNKDGFADGILQNTFNPNTQNTSDFAYWFREGTSMAVPHVAAAAALVIAAGNATTSQAVREVLMQTAEDRGVSGYDISFGSGLLDVGAALRFGVNQPPSANAGPDRTALSGQFLIFSGASSTDSDGVITKYSWSFGDGTPTGFGRKISHVYATSGVYTLTLTARDDDFATSSDTAVITIN